MTPKEVLALCRERDVIAIDLRFADLAGNWHAITVPADGLTEELFEDGIGIDGSAFAGWQPIEESDLLIVPQSETAFVDPIAPLTTLNLICSIQDPFSREDYSRDPRSTARKSIAFLKSTSIADVAVARISASFLLHDQSGDGLTSNQMNSISDFPYTVADFPQLLTQLAGRCGADVATIRRTPAADSSWNCEAQLKQLDLLSMADRVMIFKELTDRVARCVGGGAHLNPTTHSSSANANSDMRVSLGLWNNGQPVFAGAGYAGTSEAAIFAVGGILKHIAALSAFGNPSVESFARLAALAQTQFKSGYSQRDRSVVCRLPGCDSSPNARMVEFRLPDLSANPYLLFAAMMMAAIDGIQNKIDPGESFDSWSFDDDSEKSLKPKTPAVPKSFEESIEALRTDHQFLLRGDVFTSDLIDEWIKLSANSI